MLTLEWSASHAVFVNEVDDEHAELFQNLAALNADLVAEAPRAAIRKRCRALAAQADGHFAHEERLMRAARYSSYRWHRRLHDAARARLKEYVARHEAKDNDAPSELAAWLASWLDNHTRVADMMLGAFLRNHRRGVCKITFRAGTRPADSCNWVDSTGEKFDPGA